MFLNSPLGMLVAFALTVGVLVTVHEYGHFLVARLLGVRVLRFSIGFGRPLFRWFGKTGVEYVIALIPLGGYVKMLDERIGPVAPNEIHQAFNRQTVGRRIAIVSAGPLVNFLFAILAYWVVFTVGITHIKPIIGEVTEGSPASVAGLQSGQEIVSIAGKETISWQAVYLTLLEEWGEKRDLPWEIKYPESQTTQELSVSLPTTATPEDGSLLEKIGIKQYWPEVPPKIGDVAQGSPGEKAGLQKGDIILSVNGEPISHWSELVKVIQQNAEKPVTLKVQRNEEFLTLTVTPLAKKEKDGKQLGFIGVQTEAGEWPPHLLNVERYNPVSAFWHALLKTGDISLFSLKVVYKMIQGQMSSKNLGGPIAIAKGASASLEAGWTPYLVFLALLSISLGLLNLFPIPMLDGGHLLFYGIELVRGKALSEKVQAIAIRIGFIVLISLMLFALYNDLALMS